MTARLPPRRYSGSSELDRASTPTVGSGSATGGDPEFVENEVRALGLLIFQAAKHGSVDALRFALRCKGAKEHINYQEKTTQVKRLLNVTAHVLLNGSFRLPLAATLVVM